MTTYSETNGSWSSFFTPSPFKHGERKMSRMTGRLRIYEKVEHKTENEPHPHGARP